LFVDSAEVERLRFRRVDSLHSMDLEGLRGLGGFTWDNYLLYGKLQYFGLGFDIVCVRRGAIRLSGDDPACLRCRCSRVAEIRRLVEQGFLHRPAGFSRGMDLLLKWSVNIPGVGFDGG